LTKEYEPDKQRGKSRLACLLAIFREFSRHCVVVLSDKIISFIRGTAFKQVVSALNQAGLGFRLCILLAYWKAGAYRGDTRTSLLVSSFQRSGFTGTLSLFDKL